MGNKCEDGVSEALFRFALKERLEKERKDITEVNQIISNICVLCYYLTNTRQHIYNIYQNNVLEKKLSFSVLLKETDN